MNILLLSPSMSKKFNDNYYAYLHMCNLGNNILVITQRQDINKSGNTELCLEYEIDGNFTIHRLFNSLRDQKSLFKNLVMYSKIKNILFKFQPDIIFCEELTNIPLAIKIKHNFKIPIILRVEFPFDIENPYRTMGRLLKYFRTRLTGDYLPVLIGKTIWRLACKYSDSVIYCYRSNIEKRNDLNRPFFNYVPWPTHHPKISTRCERIQNRAIFVGSFDRHKNINEFKYTLPLLFQHTPLQEFWIVGTGEDLNIINTLKDRYPNKIKHIVSLSRHECLELIRTSHFSYSPAVRGGWGFIGDSWATKTPVVVTHNHYDFRDGIDSIVTTPGEIVTSVNILYSQPHIYNSVSFGGHSRYINNHSSESVGDQYYNICKSVLR